MTDPFSGFARGFTTARNNKRLREQFAIQEADRQAREKRLGEQFEGTQKFREDQAAKLEEYRKRQLQQQEENAAAISKYRQGQQELAVKQSEIQKKSFDLQVWQRMDKAFDPKIPMSARKIIMKQTAKMLEIDPKSEQYKQFETMLNDPEAANTIKKGLSALAPKASPGQIADVSKSIMNGDLDMSTGITALQKAIETQQMQEVMAGDNEGAESTPDSEGAEGEQAGVPTRKVQSSRILNPTPMAQQKGLDDASVHIPPGGTLTPPGYGGGDVAEPQPGTPPPPTEKKVSMTPEMARDKARQFLMLGTDNGRAQANALLQYARDTDKKELKVIVDPSDPTKNMYVTSDMAEGLEAPSARDVETPQEAASKQVLKGLADIDVKKVQNYSTDAETARSMQAPMEAFRAANESGNFEPGTLGGLRATLSRIGDFLGVDPALMEKLKAAGLGDPSTADILEATSNQIGLQMADRLGRVTNMSLGFIQQAGPSIFRTKEGNDAIMELMDKANQRAIKIDNKFQEYVERYSGEGGNPLRPKGKQSFFDWVNEERAKPLVEEGFINKFKTATNKANKLKSLADSVESAFESGDAIELGGDKFDVVGKSEKGLPLLKMGNGREVPYASDKKQVGRLTPAEQEAGFLWYDPDTGQATIVYRKPKK